MPIDESTLTERQLFWLEHVRRCEASGQSVKAYAAEHDVSEISLYSYRKRFGGLRTATPRLVRAQVASATLPCRVLLRNGLVVEFGVAGDELAGVLRTLSELR